MSVDPLIEYQVIIPFRLVPDYSIFRFKGKYFVKCGPNSANYKGNILNFSLDTRIGMSYYFFKMMILGELQNEKNS